MVARLTTNESQIRRNQEVAGSTPAVVKRCILGPFTTTPYQKLEVFLLCQRTAMVFRRMGSGRLTTS